jgi:O-antigen/teichoic acid export membrane protein
LARQWRKPLLCSLADQALVSGSHFAASLLLARWLTPAAYGAFALSYAVLLLAAGIYSSLLLDPLGAIGPSRYAERLRGYLGLAAWMHAGLSLPLAAALAAVALVARLAGSGMWTVWLSLSVAVPGVLLLWLFRRACYLMDTPEAAVQGSLLYALLVGMSLVVVARAAWAGPAAVFLVMATSSLLVSFTGAARLGLGRRELSWRNARAGLRPAAREHWEYGRWLLGRTAAYWAASSLYLPLVGVLAGLPAVAAYRAADNLTQPMGQSLTAVTLYLLPWMSRQRVEHGAARLRAIAVRVSTAAALSTAVYVLAVLAAGPGLLDFLYGGKAYSTSFRLMPLLGAALIFRAFGDTGLGMAARAFGRPDIEFRATAAAATASLCAGLLLVARYGATGAAVGLMLSGAASCLTAAFLLNRSWKALN